jgi:acyl-CoA synthetase (NDP forming)
VKKGVKGAVLITAGFAEVGREGKLLEDEVVGIAQEGGIRFVGPNGMGIWSAAAKLNLSFEQAPLAGSIAFVSQSGTFGGSLSEIAGAKGYGLSKFILPLRIIWSTWPPMKRRRSWCFTWKVLRTAYGS